MREHEEEIYDLRAEVLRLQEKLEKYNEAIALWDALDLEPNDQVSEATLLAKVADFENGGTVISVSATDSLDWITQLGLIHAAEKLITFRTRE